MKEGIVKVIDHLPKPHLFFIDGDHTNSGVLNEWATIAPYLVSRDIFVFHDMVISGIQKAVKTIKDSSPEIKRSQYFTGTHYPRGLTVAYYT